MPSINLTPTQAMAHTVKVNVNALMAAKNITPVEIAKRIGVSKGTMYTRKSAPETWRLDELCRLATVLKTTVAWLITPHEIGKD